MTRIETCIAQAFETLQAQGWEIDKVSDDPNGWELCSRARNRVDVMAYAEPDTGGAANVFVGYSGEDGAETFAQITETELTVQALVDAVHGAALKDAELSS